ncbi:MAG: 4Fe-4S binding protein [Promethearchaeota archaeon]
MKNPKIGVYVCHCGTNIAGVVDVEEVTEYAKTLPNVTIARNYQYMCSETGQNLIKEDILADAEENRVNRVIVSACSPRLHELTFRKVLTQAGLNPYYFEMANIREQDSWVHMNAPKKATTKAKDLIRMAVGKVDKLEPLSPIEVKINPSVLIVGAGISGISAALDLGEAGYKTWLIEKSPTIGGNMARLDKTFPTMDCSACILTPKMSETSWNENIEIIANAEVSQVEGFVGNFHVQVVEQPKYVDSEKCNACGDCPDVCPISVPSEFDLGLAPRKAIYIPFPQAIPNKYIIDMDNCIRCDKCVEVCKPEAIDFNQKPKNHELNPGQIIVATGFEPYDPLEDSDRLQYGIAPNVITGLEMERLLNASGPTQGKLFRASDGEKPKRVAFIQCVGSRDVNRNPYCSRVCCMYSIKHARMLREKDPTIQTTIYYMDIRAFGKGYEEFYDIAQRDYGIKLIRGRVSQITEDKKTNNLLIKAEDTLLGRRVNLEYDLVVLAIGLVPRKDTLDLVKMLNLSQSADGFFLEAHPKLAPVDTFIRGIYICGVAQGPKDIPDSVAQAKGAASSAIALISKGYVEIEPYLPEVDVEACQCCGICEQMCPYHAIKVQEFSAEVNDALCHGCGICSSECPVGAIQLRHYKDEQILAQIEALFSEKEVSHVSGQ